MRTLLLFALLVPCIALGAPRKVGQRLTVPADKQAVEQSGKEKAGAKAHGDPHVDTAPAAEKAKVKATTKTVEAPAKQ